MVGWQPTPNGRMLTHIEVPPQVCTRDEHDGTPQENHQAGNQDERLGNPALPSAESKPQVPMRHKLLPLSDNMHSR